MNEQMKEAAETLDTSLDQLQASFSSISSLAGSLARPTPPHPLPPSPSKFDPLVHLPPLLALPALLRSLASPRDRTSADRLWGEWEPALRSFEEAGIAGAKEIGQECREVLRSARRNSLGSPELGGRPSISVA